MSDASEKSKSACGLKVFHKGLILSLAPLIIEIALIGALAYLLSESDKESLRETKYRQCAAIGAKLIVLGNDSLIAVLGCYQGDTGMFLQIYDSTRRKLAERQKQLIEIASADPLSKKSAGQLIASLNDLTDLLDTAIQPAREKKRIIELAEELEDLKTNFIEKRVVIMDRLRSVTRLQEEIAEASSARRKRLQSLQFQILAAGVIANLAAGFSLLAFYRSGIYLPVQLVIKNTLSLAEGLPLSPRLSGNDEISQLDLAFHKMDSDLKLTLQREKALFENVRDVICVIDQKLKFLKINPACWTLWGYRDHTLLGKSVTSLIVDEQKETARQLFTRALDKNELADLEFTVSTADGKSRESLWSSYYSQHEQNLYCVVHDITERKQLEKQKQAFIAMMSSDLRQPLFRISENISKLTGQWKEELTTKAISRLDIASKNIERLLALVSDLLQMLELKTVRVEAARRVCKVDELLQRAAGELEILAQKSNIVLEIDCRASQWYVDPDKIMRVLINLGSNAVKFSPAGGTVIFRAAGSGPFVEVEIIDRGRGVPESQQKVIFEKFTQVNAADGKRKAGTGLGLPICKDIIESQEGQIGVRSVPDGGSIFWFRLAREAESCQQETTLPVKNPEPETNTVAIPESTQPGELKRPNTMGMNLTLMQKGLVLIVIPVIFEIIIVLGIFGVLLQTEKSLLEEQHQREIAYTSYQIQQAYFSASQLVVSPDSPASWLSYDKQCSRILLIAETLKGLVRGDANARLHFESVEKINAKVASCLNKGRSIMADGFSPQRFKQALPNRYELWAYAITVAKKLGKLIDEAERKESVNPIMQGQLRRQQGLLLLLGLAGSTFLSFALARFFSKDITSRLATQADNAGRFARDLRLNPVLSGRDEIAQLDRAFHETAEKLAEARRKERAVFHNSRDLICLLDSQGRFKLTNPAAERLTGYTTEELSDKSLFQLLAEDEKESARQIFQEEMSGEKSLELKLTRSDGQILYLVLSLSRSLSEDCVYCVGHDISQRKELEQIKQDFLSVVSHDLRSPLTSMIAAASLIEAGACGPCGLNASMVAKDIIVQGDELIELISDLLDLEKLEAGKLQLIKLPVSSKQVTEQALAGALARASEITVVEDPESCILEMEADPERLAQALGNIFSYIARATKDAGISIKWLQRESGVRLEILSANQTLTKEDCARLFDRIAAAGLKQKTGATLAMPLAASIVKAHDGTISTYPGITGGTIYHIDMPSKLLSNSDRHHKQRGEL